MVSRDMQAHLGTVAVTVLVLVSVQYAGLLPDSGPVLGVVALVAYGAIFGGAHLYLAVRGEDGMVSVRSRWRYLATLSVVLVAGIVYVVADGATVGPLAVRSLALGVAGIATVGYLGVESIDAYRSAL